MNDMMTSEPTAMTKRGKAPAAITDIEARTVTHNGAVYALDGLPAHIITGLALKGLRLELVGTDTPSTRYADLLSGERAMVRTAKPKTAAMTDIQIGLATTLAEERIKVEKVSGIDKARRAALLDEAKADIMALDRASLALAKSCALARRSLLTIPALAGTGAGDDGKRESA
ncbi:MAG TPA: hypothetical protein VN702_17430 [Acetobacteraceae bacterium]|nr:hypothetical protein [Acetobacteraceae bacterium]